MQVASSSITEDLSIYIVRNASISITEELSIYIVCNASSSSITKDDLNNVRIVILSDCGRKCLAQ